MLALRSPPIFAIRSTFKSGPAKISLADKLLRAFVPFCKQSKQGKALATDTIGCHTMVTHHCKRLSKHQDEQYNRDDQHASHRCQSGLRHLNQRTGVQARMLGLHTTAEGSRAPLQQLPYLNAQSKRFGKASKSHPRPCLAPCPPLSLFSSSFSTARPFAWSRLGANGTERE